MLKPFNARWPERNECVAPPQGEEETHSATEHRHDHALEQQLPNNLPATRAHCRANGKLPRPRRSACGEQVREVRTRDQQNQANSAEEQDEILAIVANQMFQERRHDRGLARVRLGIQFLEPRGDRLHLRPGLFECHARFEPPPAKRHRVHGAVLPRRAPPHDR